ncbi:cell division protein ZapA [Meridianimarinicoccus aquatilis]|uniref:Cell division protein ZapA n=1 Tax=Meridianimarinicoccus aquatilis TaxID=2552766 RepID=A0A4R6B5A5_9RHOB|nr:cell division protein ZapA [Fluviibacterium aquatile]QIE42136.1 cell division protein ZapA [Rhodobacteraceae bacterium SC52]TDL90946.1 cell division protein ZapA [Fluviibacterium aquatile]
MPEVHIAIGGRQFEVACQEGEQPFLESAAAMLDAEAQTMTEQLGRIPESRMLLMAGLLLADKTISMEDRVASLEAEITKLQTQLSDASTKPAQRIEVPVIPAGLSDSLAELAAQAEALAEDMEQAAPA